MFKNYLKITVRHFQRQKLYTFIIIASLAVGLALFLLAANYADFHFSFDTFHKDANRIYALCRAVPSGNQGEIHDMSIPAPVLPLMRMEFPEIEDSVRFVHISTRVMRSEDKKHYESNVCFVDPNIARFFSFAFVLGNPETAFEKPNCVVIPKSIAIKYFGNQNPLGRVITMDLNNTELTVSGVTENIPYNSSLKYDFLVSPDTLDWSQDWETMTSTFLKLRSGADIKHLEARLPIFIQTHVPEFYHRRERMYFFPLLDAHLKALNMHGDPFETTTPVQFYLILANAIVLLLIVCFNFMNLSTARYLNRAKEVGIRKVVGAFRRQLVKQFLGESLVLSFASLPFAFVLYEIIRPVFLAIIGGRVDISLFRNPSLFILLAGVTFSVGIFSGSYPAFFLSAFKPVQALKRDIQGGNRSLAARKILVVAQFAMSTLLIVMTLVVSKQRDYLIEVDLGYNRKNIIVFPINRRVGEKLEPLKRDLLQHPDIKAVAMGIDLPFDWRSENSVRPKGTPENQAMIMNDYAVNYDYTELLEMKIVQGRSFSREYQDENSFVLSQLAAHRLGWDDPVGKELIVGDREGRVIGVAGDFHFNHVFFKKSPAVLFLRPDSYNFMLVKCRSFPEDRLIMYLDQKWKEYIPALPFEHFILDHRFKEDFREATQSAESFQYISFISIIISCLGLFGLTLYTVERRTKEIGMRKVLGASFLKIIKILVSDFLKLVFLANIIAVPLAYYGAFKFLQWAWVYKTRIDAWIFVLAAALSIGAALFSVIFQTSRAASANPIDALRNE